MRWINYIIIFFMIVLMYSCSSKKFNSYHFPFHIVTSTHIKKVVDGSRLKINKDLLKLYIRVHTDSNYFRNSKYLLQIDIWDKTLFGSSPNDSIFLYEGIETYFGSTDLRFKKLFNKEFKFITSKKSNKSHNSLTHAISEVSFYFNKENEITYISPVGYDTIYYNLLKDKVNFSKIFMDNLGKDQ